MKKFTRISLLGFTTLALLVQTLFTYGCPGCLLGGCCAPREAITAPVASETHSCCAQEAGKSTEAETITLNKVQSPATCACMKAEPLEAALTGSDSFDSKLTQRTMAPAFLQATRLPSLQSVPATVQSPAPPLRLHPSIPTTVILC
ncbi:MAG: hypothetical protein ACYTGH_10855 [Planctomycetota bacterium]|jgi:hypothetical protein